jgi:hypothetical protein
MKTPTQGMLQLDAIIQGVLIVPILIAYAFAIPSGGGSAIIALMLQFLLGIFQLVSALIRTIRHGSPFRRNYLLVAIGYLIVLISGGTILQEIFIGGGDLLYIILGIGGLTVIPMLMAIFYWVRTIQQSRGKFEEAVGFEKRQNLATLAEGDADDRVIEEIIQRQKERIRK